ncbi:MAG: ABC transporter ATP-binding protein/permease [Nanoarchaeota archaeon]|nr:ABC transporter ATP-binding protein/permease [Nanoarchaeota archaeon]
MKVTNYTWGNYIKDIWHILDGKRKRFLFFTILRAIADLAPFGIVYALGKTVDFFTEYSEGSLKQFYILVAIMAGLGIFQVWLRFYGKTRMQEIASESRKFLRLKSTSALMEQNLVWHEKENTGSKIHRINTGGESFFKSLKDFSNSGVHVAVSIFATLFLLSAMNFKYLLYVGVFTGVYFLAEYYHNKKVQYWQNMLNEKREKASGKLHESASNMLTVKSLGLKETINQNSKDYETEYHTTWMKKRNASQFKLKTIKIWSALGYAGFVLLLGLDTAKGEISVGNIVIFASYFGKLNGALHIYTTSISEYIENKSGVGRLMDLLPKQALAVDSRANFPKDWRAIKFENINFKYKKKSVLKGFSLKIQRNEKIGFAGASGCGKSTLIKLMLGLYKPDRGKITVDGIDINEFNHNSLIEKFSVVLQESEIFNISLIENVCITSQKMDMSLFGLASKSAQLDQVIKRLPESADTLIGEKGYKLSGGERQRVGIARAIYKNSPVLILDEATSSLDSKTEARIQKSIEKYRKFKTLLVIAHRLSTLKNMDRIVVMDKGRIVEQGTYNELIMKKGLFWELNRRQK